MSAEDVQQAIAEAQKGIFGARPSGAAYRVHVIDRNNVEVYFGEHYGLGAPMGAVIYLVERAGGRWVVAGIKLGLTNRSSQPLAVAMRTLGSYETVPHVCHARRSSPAAAGQQWLSFVSLGV